MAMELFRILGRVGLNGVEETNRELENTSSNASKAGEKIGKAFSTMGKVAVAGIAAAGAGIVALTKSSVDAYANYEQLVGGVDTLFKESSKTIQTYAANAYKTAGVSANQYMEMATSFSASLLQSLGGDTKQAAEVTQMAITDMSDNMNKMGSSMESIQYAYQGFAKQNYTMLDNLKLGYGGTKEEMERLLADAEKISGVKYDINNLSDVYNAIHVIQTELGITGTTAKEAATTIQGSAAAMKAAWQNMLVGVAQENANFEIMISNLMETVVTYLNNLIPRITIIINNIVAVLPNALNAIIPVVTELLGTLLNAAVTTFVQLLNALISMIPQLIPVVTQAVNTILEALIQALPLIIQAGIQLIGSLIQGIGQALPQLVPMAVQAVVTIVQGLVSSLPMILQAALELIKGLAQGILNAIPILIAALPQVINSIVQFLLNSIPQIVDAGIELLTSLIDALPTIINTVVTAIPQIVNGLVNAIISSIPKIVDSGVKLLTSLIQNLPTIISTILKAIPQIIGSLVNAIAQNVPKIVEAGVNLLTSLIKNLPQIIAAIVKAMPQIIVGIVKALGEGVSQVAQVGVNLVKGLWEGIKSAASWLWNKITGWLGDIWDGILGFFGIHSPSRKMAWAGEMMVKGMGEGVEDNSEEALEPMEQIKKELIQFDDLNVAKSVKIDPLNVNPDTSTSNEIRFLGTYLERLVTSVEKYLPEFGNRDIVLDTGELVGAMAGNIDYTMGEMYRRKERGG